MEVVDAFKYKVFIGEGLLQDLDAIIDTKVFSKVIVITDEKIPSEILSQYEKIVVPSGESNKNIETVQVIWKKLLELKADRKTLVINLGGGVIGDMGGFAAATYMRGIKFLQVPTTLLSTVDASVGGKVGIDFEGIKNLIGSFNQPIGVVVDINTFKSLPDREFISGFGEIIKHGIIADKEYFNLVTSKKPKEFSDEELIKIIRRSVEIKSQIVSNDEKESGQRKLLNFGHTIGHALESASLQTSNPLLHGEAVSLGMITEAKISQLKNLLSENDFQIIKKSLENSMLPIKAEIKNKDEILNLLSKDKKAESGKVNWTLVKNIGEAIFDQQVDGDLVLQSLESIS